MKRLILILLFAITSYTLFAQVASPYAQVSGRTLMGILEKPSYNGQKEGVVIVSVWIDQYGSVTKAQAGAPGSTLLDAGAWEAARNAALKTHFNQSADAPSLQEGTISYFFSNESSKLNNDETSAVSVQQTASPKYAKLYFIYVSGDLTMAVSKWGLDSIEFFDENGNIQKYSRVSGGKSSETIILNSIIEKGYKMINSNIAFSNRDYYTCMIVDYLLEKI